jgi:hypothetical protein
MAIFALVLRIITSIVFFIILLAPTFSKCLLVLDYQCNKNYIATYLCENRDKPEMKCEGRCYLCKRFKKEEKKDQDNPERKAETRFETVTQDPGFQVNEPFRPVTSIEYAYYQENNTFSYTAAFFHPPQVA